MQQIQRNARLWCIGLGAFALLCFAFAGAADRSIPFVLQGLAYFILCLLFYIDARFFVHLDERTQFRHWMGSPTPRMALVAWLLACCSLGLAQLLGQATAGSQEALFHAVGAVYPALDAGEWWRLLTGAYLHYSPAHFAVNLFFTAFIGMIASPLLGWRAVAAFVAGNAVAAYAQYELGGRVYDNFGGISGGGYALCGVLIVGALLDRLLLPRGLPLLLAGLTAVGILGAEAFSDSAATTAHVAGLVTGAAVAAATVRRVTAS